MANLNNNQKQFWDPETPPKARSAKERLITQEEIDNNLGSLFNELHNAVMPDSGDTEDDWVASVDNEIEYKFNERNYIDEFQQYIDKTYEGHYSTNKFQSTEVIIDRGNGTGFCMGNVDKYSNRYGNKGTRDDARKDLMKILHYALIQLHVHDNEL